MLTIKRLLYNVHILFEKREGYSRLERNLHKQIQCRLLMSLGIHDLELSCKVMTYCLRFQNETEKTGNQFLFILYRKLDLKGQFTQKQKFFHHAHTQKRYSEECWVQTALTITVFHRRMKVLH